MSGSDGSGREVGPPRGGRSSPLPRGIATTFRDYAAIPLTGSIGLLRRVTPFLGLAHLVMDHQFAIVGYNEHGARAVRALVSISRREQIASRPVHENGICFRFGFWTRAIFGLRVPNGAIKGRDRAACREISPPFRSTCSHRYPRPSE